MRAIIFKELRELSIWFGLMLLSLAAWIKCALYLGTLEPVRDRYIRSTINDVQTQGFITLAVFCGFGLAIGLLQGFRDYPTGRWAFVTHRPISRAKMFLAKVIAGITAYLLVTCLPLAALFTWLAIPGNVAAPFDWHLMLPAATGVSDGVIWYAAALLIIHRQARWYGSRLFPLGFALIATVASIGVVTNFFQSAVVCAFAIALLLVAARGAFLSSGSYERQPFVVRLIQGLCIAPGLAIVIGAAGGAVYQTIDFFMAMPSEVIYKHYEVTIGGTIAYVESGPKGQATTFIERVPQDEQARLPSENLWLRGYDPNTMSRDQRLNTYPYFGLSTYVWTFPGSEMEPKWYYVASRRTMEEYHPRSNRLIGFLEPDGYVPADQPTQPFSEPLLNPNQAGPWWNSVIHSAHSAYAIYPSARSIKKIFQTTGNETILDVAASTLPYHPGGGFDGRFIMTESAIHVFDENYSERFVLPLNHPHAYTDYPFLQIGELYAGGFALEYPQHPGHPYRVVITDSSGKILRDQEMSYLQNNFPADPAWEMPLVAAAVPPGLALLRLRDLIRNELGMSKTEAAVWALSALIWSAACWLIFPRYESRRGARILWAVCGALLGVGGFVLLLCLRESPGRVRCPACGKRRLVTRDLCEHCGQPFEKPAMKGIEIFEGGEVAAMTHA